jgi:hypothetical protein
MVQRFTDPLTLHALRAALESGEREKIVVRPVPDGDKGQLELSPEVLAQVLESGLVITQEDESSEGGLWRTFYVGRSEAGKTYEQAFQNALSNMSLQFIEDEG